MTTTLKMETAMMFSLQEAAPLVLESNSVDKCRLTWTGKIVGRTFAKAMSTLEALDFGQAS